MREHRLRIGDRDVILVAGPAGWGEASPLPGYACGDGASRRAAEESARDGWPAAVRDTVPVNALVDNGPVDPGALAGFPAVKVKVGRRDPRDDLDLVAAVRDSVGPSVALRVDANGMWDVDTAEAMIRRLAPYELELVEQPVAGLDDLARLRRRVDVPLAADECVRSVGDARCLATLHAADVVVLKVQPLGGVRTRCARRRSGSPLASLSLPHSPSCRTRAVSRRACPPATSYAIRSSPSTVRCACDASSPIRPCSAATR